MNQLDDTLPETCPECGAPRVDGMDCALQLGAVCAWEWQDPELLALHFVTVASFNLQHPAQFTDEAFGELRKAFIDHWDRGTRVSEIRRRMAAAAEGKTRVLKDRNARTPVSRRWITTIADVYLADRPEGAADRVRAWAGSIRHEI